jgi:hypothetical protein
MRGLSGKPSIGVTPTLDVPPACSSVVPTFPRLA